MSHGKLYGRMICAWLVLMAVPLSGEEYAYAVELPPRRPSGRVSPVSGSEENPFNTIMIGNQLWMAENLNTQRTVSGDLLDGVYSYDNNEDYVEEYGRLYNWEAAMRACPDGWHLPTNAEWDELISTLGPNASDQLKEGGTSGFEAKMGGLRTGDSYGYIGELGLHWTSTEADDHATQKLIVVNESDVNTGNIPKINGLSVRCVGD